MHEILEELYKELKLDRNRYLIKASYGNSNWANIPWIAIFDKEITVTAQEGYYIVILFNADMSGFYLSLNQGYRPNEKGNFELKEGKFYELVQKARQELERAKEAKEEPKKFCMIIDEINRGNLSKIFGELIMLIENNKREEKYSIKLTYSDEPFYIPENLYIIGTMNTADRSLAMMDYALKRRFGFIKLEPIYEDAKFEEYLIKTQKLNKNIAHQIATKYTELNKYMESNLGEEFKIGHSYFMEEQFEPETFEETYKSIVNCEIKPIIEEYFYGDKEKIKEAISKIELDGDIHE